MPFSTRLISSLIAALWLGAPMIAGAEPQASISMLGEPHYKPGFTHFDYAEPDAAKGGKLRQAVFGTFSNLNPFVVRGDPAFAVRELVFEPLMARSKDEAFSLYGLIAETIETPPDRSWVEFTLRKEAHFSDATAITPEDVLFSWEVLRDHGRPNHRSYYPKVARAEKVGERGVRFTFKPGTDREMPLIMGLMPVLPRHAYSADTFEQPKLTALGSGPYMVAEVNSGRNIRLKRDPSYWGRDLPVAKGRFNFDEIDFEFYQDQTAMFEAFKAGQHDVTEETDAGQWQTGYDFPAVKSGAVKKTEVDFALPAPASVLVFNTRRPLFADQRVRKALDLLFDFEWINHNLYHGAYTRLESFFDHSSLSSHGVAANEAERALLLPFASAVTPEALAGAVKFPVSDGQGWNRENTHAALNLLKTAGWELKGTVLTNAATGQPFTFEFLVQSRSEERLLLAFASQLKRAGIDAHIRLVDAAQYQERLNAFSFDMIQNVSYPSLSPGNEQNFQWSSKAADEQGSYNFAGVKNPAADAMIDALIHAKDQDGLIAAVRALDRVLLSGDYVIPLSYQAHQWVALRSHLRYPAKTSLYGYQLDTWWADPKTPPSNP